MTEAANIFFENYRMRSFEIDLNFKGPFRLFTEFSAFLHIFYGECGYNIKIKLCRIFNLNDGI